MSLISAMYAGVSGLQTLVSSMQVIGNNVANVNTAGFKSSRTEFGDLLAQSLGSSSQIGRGVRLQTVTPLMSQGSFLNTSAITDMAISGEGFFCLTDGVGEFYTRAGAFRVNSDGILINNSGLYVQGYQYDDSGNNTGVIGNINLSNLATPPSATADVFMSANLSAEAEILADPWDINDPAATSNYSSSITIYDSLGNSHSVTVYFRKTADNTWNWYALVDGSEIDGGTPGTPVQGANGTLSFTDDGKLDNETIVVTGWDFANGATAGQQITFDFGDSITGDGGTGLGGMTQFAGEFVPKYQIQDGYAAGSLRTISIGTDGVITGIFSNGKSRDIAQIALATFRNTAGLLMSGDNMMITTNESGDPTIAAPGVGNAGSISPSTLELSNVDLSKEFVNLITAQRAFQANTRIITTSDELMAETLNLKR